MSIERDDGSGSKKSVLSARHDDDDYDGSSEKRPMIVERRMNFENQPRLHSR